MTIYMMILRYFPYPEGGAERQCRKLVKEFESQGHSCVVVTSWDFGSSPRRDREDRTTIYRCGFLGAFQKRIKNEATDNSFSLDGGGEEKRTSFFVKVRRALIHRLIWVHRLWFMMEAFCVLALKRKEIKILHVHQAHWLAGYGAWLGAVLGVRVLCKEATFPLRVGGKNDLVPLDFVWRKWALRGSYIAMHQDIYDALIAMGIKESSLCLVPNGVELPDGVESDRKDGSVIYVGNFSQLNEIKAFDVLLRAWAIVHRALPEAVLCMVGGGDSAIWKAFARKLSCQESVRFVGSQSDLSSYYRRASLHVLPSRKEGMSNALLEAQSYGVPSVVSDIPGNLSVIKNGLNGVVVPVGDDEAMAEAILMLLGDADSRSKMGARARELVEDVFSLKIVTTKLLMNYQLR